MMANMTIYTVVYIVYYFICGVFSTKILSKILRISQFFFQFIYWYVKVSRLSESITWLFLNKFYSINLLFILTAIGQTIVSSINQIHKLLYILYVRLMPRPWRRTQTGSNHWFLTINPLEKTDLFSRFFTSSYYLMLSIRLYCLISV